MLYTIELGTKEDLKQIMNVSKDIFRKSNPDLAKKETYKTLLDKKKHLILLAKEDKYTIAYTVAIDRNKNYHIHSAGISEDYAKKGFTVKLLDKNEQFAKKGEFKAITITAYSGQNELIKILEEKGYKEYRSNSKEGSKDFKLEI